MNGRKSKALRRKAFTLGWLMFAKRLYPENNVDTISSAATSLVATKHIRDSQTGSRKVGLCLRGIERWLKKNDPHDSQPVDELLGACMKDFKFA